MTLVVRASEVFSIYNGRSRIEPQYLDMKDDYTLGHIVTKHFGVNDVITQATIMIYQQVSHFKRHCLRHFAAGNGRAS